MHDEKKTDVESGYIYMVEALETVDQDGVLEAYRDRLDAIKRVDGLKNNGQQFTRWWPERLR